MPRRLGIDSADLVGNDSGGSVAQLIVARAPQRVRTLTLTNCEAHDNFPPAAFASVHQMAREGTLAAGLAALADAPGPGPGRDGLGLEHPERLSDETALGYFAPFASADKAEAVQGYVASMDSSVTVAIRDDLARFGHPTLIVSGTADQFFAVSWARWLAGHYPRHRSLR